MLGLVGSAATLNAITPLGTPLECCQVAPPSVERNAPRPANVPPPPKTLSPVTITSVPLAYAIPPTAGVGSESPIECQCAPRSSDCQAPPSPTAANTRSPAAS